jgi:hypothetical protein
LPSVLSSHARANTSAVCPDSKSGKRGRLRSLLISVMQMTLAIRQTFKDAAVEFIDENGGGPGVRLKKPHKKRS